MYSPDVFAAMYAVRYETEEDFKAGREQIEAVLEKSMLKNTVVFKPGDGSKFYPVGVSDKTLDGQTDILASMSGNDEYDELDEKEKYTTLLQTKYKVLRESSFVSWMMR